MLLLFNNGADLVVEDLTYLGRLPLRGHVLFLQGFRDSLRLRTYFELYEEISVKVTERGLSGLAVSRIFGALAFSCFGF